MKIFAWLYFILFGLIFSAKPAHSKVFSSSHEVTELIELYTSEGCSSCPPADRWFSRLKSDPQLFKKIIPLSFHVDYWNDLGWKDRFSKRLFSNRQYKHHKAGNISQVYTPGMMIDNQEWRSWRFSKFFNRPDNLKHTGILKVSLIDHQQANISFKPDVSFDNKTFHLNIAVLGMGLVSNINLGENQGLRLKHDFVVLNLKQEAIGLINSDMNQWKISIPKVPQLGQTRDALVVWLSESNSQHVIQATGGYL